MGLRSRAIEGYYDRRYHDGGEHDGDPARASASSDRIDHSADCDAEWNNDRAQRDCHTKSGRFGYNEQIAINDPVTHFRKAPSGPFFMESPEREHR